MDWVKIGTKMYNAMLFQRIYAFEINDIVLLLGTKFYFSTSAFLLAYISISSWDPHRNEKNERERKKERKVELERQNIQSGVPVCLVSLHVFFLYTMRSLYRFFSLPPFILWQEQHVLCKQHTMLFFILNCRDFINAHTYTKAKRKPNE